MKNSGSRAIAKSHSKKINNTQSILSLKQNIFNTLQSALRLLPFIFDQNTSAIFEKRNFKTIQRTMNEKTKKRFLTQFTSVYLGLSSAPLLSTFSGLSLFSKLGHAQNNKRTANGTTDFGVSFLTAASAGYQLATKTYYPSPCQRPDRVYQPKNEAELGNLIRGLRSRGQRFTIRGRGHSFDNRSSNSNIVIDTTQLKGSGNGVKLDSNTGLVTVRSGAVLGGTTINSKKTKMKGLYDVLSQNNRILAAGTCPDVGVIGNVLGGGLSATPYLGFGAKGLKRLLLYLLKMESPTRLIKIKSLPLILRDEKYL